MVVSIYARPNDRPVVDRARARGHAAEPEGARSRCSSATVATKSACDGPITCARANKCDAEQRRVWRRRRRSKRSPCPRRCSITAASRTARCSRSRTRRYAGKQSASSTSYQGIAPGRRRRFRTARSSSVIAAMRCPLAGRSARSRPSRACCRADNAELLKKAPDPIAIDKKFVRSPIARARTIRRRCLVFSDILFSSGFE